jgi:hypothetical protein
MLTKIDQQKIWVVGSIERLASLGYFKRNFLEVEEEFVETYWRIDDDRHEIIDNGEEIFKIILELYPDLCLDDVVKVHKLLGAFKNSRTTVFASGMQKICLV